MSEAEQGVGCLVTPEQQKMKLFSDTLGTRGHGHHLNKNSPPCVVHMAAKLSGGGEGVLFLFHFSW